ncbi:MAG TPA: TipAS antibiotic-recognition domain-containing protein, partial [Telluria sp.]|nr:TipAS antibiotic-recognition domain-containing protein [Telluria sp.]
ELAQLPLYAKPELKDEWRELVAVVTQVMADGALPSDRRSQELARTWMKRIVRDTAGNPVLFAKLNAMHENEAEVQAETGVTRALMDFILAAKRESALAIYRQYLTDEEYAFVRANLGKRDAEWPQLIAKVRTAMDDGLAPGSPEVQALARHWFDLFRSFAGDNPATQAKIRQALMTEPALTEDGWVDAAMRDFIRAAMEAMRQAPRD